VRRKVLRGRWRTACVIAVNASTKETGRKAVWINPAGAEHALFGALPPLSRLGGNMISSQDTAVPAARHAITRVPTPAQSALVTGLRPSASATRSCAADGECEQHSEAKIAWTHDEIVMLHAVLFDTCVERLNDPETPLDEVIDCLRWIFSEPRREGNAFSFSNTLRLYQRPQAGHVREAIQVGLARYLDERFKRYPAWVGDAFWRDPDRFADELERTPQRVSEALRRRTRDGDRIAA
jgi:hypothetical protein